MPSIDDARQARLAELEASILQRATAEAHEPPESPGEVSELSARAHQSIVQGTFGRERTELRVRLHGNGVKGHLVPSDQAGSMLKQTQLLVRWIGARLRVLQESQKARARDSVAEATRLFLQPQFGAGSLIFDLVADEPAPVPDEQLTLTEAGPASETLLDRSLAELLDIITSSTADAADDLGELSSHVGRMGPRVASQLKALSIQVTDNEIDLDLRWSGMTGRRRTASLGRRGALAIKDAVERNRVKVDEIPMDGILETASTGKDQVRIETTDDSYRMKVEPDLGVTLGKWLHHPVSARVERTVTWHNSGKETREYRLLGIAEQLTLNTSAEEPNGSDTGDLPF